MKFAIIKGICLPISQAVCSVPTPSPASLGAIVASNGKQNYKDTILNHCTIMKVFSNNV